jgi:hypothetical protein
MNGLLRSIRALNRICCGRREATGVAMYQTAVRRQFEDAALKVIENSLYLRGTLDADELKLQRSNSLRRRLVTDVTKAAMEHALAAAQDVETFRDFAGQGVGIVNGLEYGLTANKRMDLSENAKSVVNWNFWLHDDRPHVRIKAQNFPHIDRFSIEQDAYSYLDLPYRAPLLERTIVDILIATELFAYGKEMFEKLPVGFRWLSQSPMRQKHILRKYFGSRILGAVIFLGPAFLAGTFAPQLIGQTASDWIAGILVGLFFLDLVIATIAIPFAWRHQRKSKRTVRDLLKEMASTYAELSGDGDVSTRRLREVAARAADSGVVWPKPLFLLLDDNIARTGRL